MSGQSPFRPVSERGGSKLSDRVTSEITSKILASEFAPGDRLPTEAELGESMGVSRSVVRDALRTLSGLGLIAVKHGHGIIVAEPTPELAATANVLMLSRSDLTIGDVVNARSIMETMLAEEAARSGTPDDWAAMRVELDLFIEAARDNDLHRTEHHHRRFHLGTLSALRSPGLEILLFPLQQVVAISSIPPAIDGGELWQVELHEPILAALEAGDPERVRTAMQAHFAYTALPEHEAFMNLPFREAHALDSFQSLFTTSW